MTYILLHLLWDTLLRLVPDPLLPNRYLIPFSCTSLSSSGHSQNRQKAAGPVEPVGEFAGFLFFPLRTCVYTWKMLVHMLCTRELEGHVFASSLTGYFMAFILHYVYVCTCVQRSTEMLSHTNAFHSLALWWISSYWPWIQITWHVHSQHITFTYSSSNTLDNRLLVYAFKLRQTIKLDKQGTLWVY